MVQAAFPYFFSSSFAAAACVEISSPFLAFSLPVRFLCLPQAHS